MVRVPVRDAPVVGATVNPTAPLPVPLAPDVIAIQSVSEVAVHVHSALDGRTSTRPGPPVCANTAELSVRVYRHWPAA